MKKIGVVLVVVLTLLGGAGLQGATFKSGEQVLALWRTNGLYYVGTVVSCGGGAGGGGCFVVFDDGDSDTVPVGLIHPFTLGVGSPVLALWKDKKMYPGKIVRIVGRALFIHFDDGDRGWTSWAGIALKKPAGKSAPPPPPSF